MYIIYMGTGQLLKKKKCFLRAEHNTIHVGSLFPRSNPNEPIPQRQEQTTMILSTKLRTNFLLALSLVGEYYYRIHAGTVPGGKSRAHAKGPSFISGRISIRLGPLACALS